MTLTDKQQLADAFREIEKRDDLILIHKQGLDIEAKINKELKKQLVRERRKKIANKFIYFSAGFGSMLLISKVLN